LRGCSPELAGQPIGLLDECQNGSTPKKRAHFGSRPRSAAILENQYKLLCKIDIGILFNAARWLLLTAGVLR
jgi:hypothetical protein